MARSRPTTSSPAEARWRPKDRRGPVCGYTFRGSTCTKRGAHHCTPRADRVIAFFAELLLHTTGPYKRTPFKPRWWQEHGILRPLFGEVVWSTEWRCYVRRYRVAYIVISRKNGKSALVAGIVLYLLIGDDEEAAEVYGAAKDTKQAGKVFQPVDRMRQLSPRLAKRLALNKNARRIFDEQSSSYYEIVTSDAEGELGHNPHGFVLDEVLSQPDGSLWEAMETAQGARLQPLLVAITTETNRGASFGADLIDEAERVEEDPTRAPHVFAFVRKLPHDEQGLERLHRLYPDDPDLPVSIDVFDEANWRWPNPGLDEFLSRDSLRQAALEAHNEPAKENGFRQFRMNQRVQQASRWMPMHLYDACAGDIWMTPDYHRSTLTGSVAFGGFDLAAKFDLCAWALLVPRGDEVHMLWRFWLPEAAVPYLDKQNNGLFSRWAEQGWITVTEGDVVDYDRVYDDIGQDAVDFTLRAVDADQWSMAPVIQEIGKRTGVPDIVAYSNTYDRMSPSMGDFMALVRTTRLRHHGNPMARFCFDAVEVRRAPYNPDLVRPDKPTRDRTGSRIDAVPAAVMAVAAWERSKLVEEVQPRRPMIVRR